MINTPPVNFAYNYLTSFEINDLQKIILDTIYNSDGDDIEIVAERASGKTTAFLLYLLYFTQIDGYNNICIASYNLSNAKAILDQFYNLYYATVGAGIISPLIKKRKLSAGFENGNRIFVTTLNDPHHISGLHLQLAYVDEHLLPQSKNRIGRFLDHSIRHQRNCKSIFISSEE